MSRDVRPLMTISINRACGEELALACAFVTGESSPDRITEARATGHAIAFKPIAPAKLRAILEHLLSAADVAPRASVDDSTLDPSRKDAGRSR